MVRASTVGLALFCLAAGYALAGTRVKAVEDVSPMRFPSGIGVGTRVRLSYTSDPNWVDCTIARIEAGWVRCAPQEPDPFQKVVQHETWHSLAQAARVEKMDTPR